jgi:E3 ubiquitin-protein ligase HERC2
MRRPDASGSVSDEAWEALPDADAFAAAFPRLAFTATAAGGGGDVELLPGGRDMPVTWANRVRYADALQDFKLHEFDAQIAAVRRGFGAVVPLRALSMFTWQDVETLVCGSATIDVEYLKRHTRYDSPYNAEHPVIQRFWRVFATLAQDERSKYVQFAWGRPRLPLRDDYWGTKAHKVTPLQSSPSRTTGLIKSHTCGFSIELPQYSTDEAMRHGVLTSILYGLHGFGMS